MARTAVQLALDAAAARIVTAPTTFQGGRGGAFRMFVNNAEVVRTFKSLGNIHLFMEEVVKKVEPEFGADMPYSAILEQDTHPGRIMAAVAKNSEFIRRALQNKVSDMAIRYSRSSSTNVSAARRELEQAWADILNSKPKADAQKTAPVLYDFHRPTIMGHGRRRPDSEVKHLQRVLMAKRDAVRSSRRK